MIWGQSRVRITGSIALVAILFLQGCAAEQSSAPESTQEQVAEKPHKYNAELSPAFAEPWPELVTREEMINTALYKANNYFENLVDSQCEVKATMFFEDIMPPESIELAGEVSQKTLNSLCGFLTEDIHIIAGNYDFVKETMAAEGLPTDEFGGVCGYDVKFDDGTACATNGVAWIGSQFGTVRRGSFIPEPRRITFITHELFHLAHDSVDPDANSQIPPPEHPFFRPGWLIEGGGEFFGALLPKVFEIQDYLTMLPYDRSGNFYEVEYLSDLESLERMKGSENYYSGQVALEYITASVGIQPLLNIWIEMGKGKKFAQAFEKSIGLTVKEFYEKFAVMHDNLYEGEMVKP
jgi:hypothetical protein